MNDRGWAVQGANRGIAAALAAYAALGWAVLEVLFEFGARLGAPPSFERIALALFLAGFLATALLLWLRPGSRRSALGRAAGVLAVTVFTGLVALGIVRWFGAAAPRSDLASIAVLPCEYTGEEQFAYLGNGLAEELHARLARAAGVHVPSARAVRKALGVTTDRARIAGYLGVKHLTTCRIAQRPGDVLLSAEVLTPATREVVWSREYRYAAVSSLDLVADLANALVTVMADALGERGVARVQAPPTANRSAFEHYVQARQAQGRNYASHLQVIYARANTRAEHEAARRHFLEAIALDSGFAAAHAGLALLYGSYKEGTFDGVVREPHYAEARQLAQRALEIDPCAADALITLSLPWVVSERPLEIDVATREEIVRRVRRALECEPGNLDARRRLLSHYLDWQFDAQLSAPPPELAPAVARAWELDPTDCFLSSLRIEVWGDLGPAHERIAASVIRVTNARLTPAQTEAALATIMTLDPHCGHAYRFETRLYEGRLAEAIAWGLAWLAANPGDAGPAQALSQAYLELGLLPQAGLWECRAQAPPGGAGDADDCVARVVEPQVAAPLRGDFAATLREAQAWIERAREGERAGDKVYKQHYVFAIGSALAGRRPDLAAAYLEEGLRALGTADPAELLFWSPKRTFAAREHVLDLALACRAAGREQDARQLLELGRRESHFGDPAAVTGPRDQFLYLDAQYRILLGDHAGAVQLIRRAVAEHQAAFGWFYPSRIRLLLDPTLDPLRQDPLHAAELERVIADYETWLAPSRERALAAEATGDWAALRR